MYNLYDLSGLYNVYRLYDSELFLVAACDPVDPRHFDELTPGESRCYHGWKSV